MPVEAIKNIEALRPKLKGNIVLPGDEAYKAAIFRYSDVAVKEAVSFLCHASC